MKNLPALRNDSSFAVQFSISVSKTRAILLFKMKIKLIEMFELLYTKEWQGCQAIYLRVRRLSNLHVSIIFIGLVVPVGKGKNNSPLSP